MNDERQQVEADSTPAKQDTEQVSDGDNTMSSATPANESNADAPPTDRDAIEVSSPEGEPTLPVAEESDVDDTPSYSAEPDEATASDDVEGDTDGKADGHESAEVAKPARPVPTGPVELNLEDDEVIKHEWYILKVQSNRETSIVRALQRKVAIEGLDDYFDEILVPMEKVTEFKGGKKKIVKRKIWPGYIAVRMHVNDDTWFALRETSGIGDFTGSGGKPSPMPPEEIKKIKPPEDEEVEETPKLDIKFRLGDKVKVMEGNFENFEGEVSAIDETHGRVTVMLSIFGRPTPVELEYWQVEVV